CDWRDCEQRLWKDRAGRQLEYLLRNEGKRDFTIKTEEFGEIVYTEGHHNGGKFEKTRPAGNHGACDRVHRWPLLPARACSVQLFRQPESPAFDDHEPADRSDDRGL